LLIARVLDRVRTVLIGREPLGLDTQGHELMERRPQGSEPRMRPREQAFAVPFPLLFAPLLAL
jgi:hypothetical protein